MSVWRGLQCNFWKTRTKFAEKTPKKCLVMNKPEGVKAKCLKELGGERGRNRSFNLLIKNQFIIAPSSLMIIEGASRN